jgi:hypothetical protein
VTSYRHAQEQGLWLDAPLIRDSYSPAGIRWSLSRDVSSGSNCLRNHENRAIGELRQRHHPTKGFSASFISTRPHNSNMSQPSLAGYIIKRPWLKRWVTPLANWYANAAGYRKLGLRYGHLQWATMTIEMDSTDHRDFYDDFFYGAMLICCPLQSR